MLGLLALGLTTIMIYTLVKNALLGKQLSQDDRFTGTLELIIPITPRSEFFLEAWQSTIASFGGSTGQVKVHILIDGHHPTLNVWTELKEKIPYVEIHVFTMRPPHIAAVPWMLDQISSKIAGDVVIIGDAELVPAEQAFTSIGQLVTEKQRSYFILPQTERFGVLGEAVAVINPTLALTSFYGFRRWRKNISHPLLSISQGWMAMPLETFRGLDFKSIRLSSWKEAISRQWDEQGKSYLLAFGEKFLMRHYPEDLKIQIFQLKGRWQELWEKRARAGFWLYLAALFLWSFPILFFFSHPFWSLASLILLFMFRFFSKIVFQESWGAVFLHPFGCFVWIGTFCWWAFERLRSLKGSQAE